MLINSEEKYVPMLTELWNKVFGDDEEYIKLFFKQAFYDSECFAVIENEKIISALYLLKSKIRCCGKTYNGRYLYAAATLSEHRGQGHMSRLLNEAKAYAKEKSLDFIALVPASDSLYSYYESFGYNEAMYKYKLKSENRNFRFDCLNEITDPKAFHKIRSSSNENMLFYDEIIAKYAFECLSFSGKRVYSLNNDSLFIPGEELFCPLEQEKACYDFLQNYSDGFGTVFSNRAFDTGEKMRNGMIYPINLELINKEVYMNIALD